MHTAVTHSARVCLRPAPPAGRRLAQAPNAVCCLIDPQKGSTQCTQTQPNQQNGNTKQQGLVHVQVGLKPCLCLSRCRWASVLGFDAAAAAAL